MPSPKPYDTTINCGPNNPFTMVKRGPVNIRVLYEDIKDKSSDYFVEVRCGRRRQRTAFCRDYDVGLAIGEVLGILGFDPTVTLETMEMDEAYD